MYGLGLEIRGLGLEVSGLLSWKKVLFISLPPAPPLIEVLLTQSIDT